MKLQKRLAASVLNCSEKRVWFDPEKLSDIKEAITKFDIRTLVKRGIIARTPPKGVSRFRARRTKIQKRKERRKGSGSRKGAAHARLKPKKFWINAVRAQRDLLKRLRDRGLISKKDFHSLYNKSKGGFFRSVRHIKLYVQEQDMIKKQK
jgi:large subunit ribosomal protein L19e